MKFQSIAFCYCIVIVFIVHQCLTLSPELSEVANPISLEISVYDVSVNSVEIDWHFKDEHVKSALSCELVYGPVDDVTQVQVFTRIQLLEENIIKLSHLENNVTYHMHMVCHNGTEEKIQSNALQFTTGSKTLPLTYVMPSSNFHGRSSIPRENFYSRDEDYVRNVRSSSVILGAVCGIVGFLIINVTIVMAVRKYSHRQMRRRRILEIEERDYDEFPYLRGDE
ncbi:uncharacterized protein CEXT_173491 [Caerostris extrusa]|uniref:Fibronectin type-III domain-containing protein n=1 Tax=Caerostris extrusa TaxID=172846 RepID=A0AAV4MWJ3_CAEEX|nr:uncharacterized protein CEXT_173491 [Caerostris extrusa]